MGRDEPLSSERVVARLTLSAGSLPLTEVLAGIQGGLQSAASKEQRREWNFLGRRAGGVSGGRTGGVTSPVQSSYGLLAHLQGANFICTGEGSRRSYHVLAHHSASWSKGWPALQPQCDCPPLEAAPHVAPMHVCVPKCGIPNIDSTASSCCSLPTLFVCVGRGQRRSASAPGFKYSPVLFVCNADSALLSRFKLLVSPPSFLRNTQWLYFLGFIACTVAAWALRDYGSSALDFSPVNDCLADTSPPDYSCMGQQVRWQACRLQFCVEEKNEVCIDSPSIKFACGALQCAGHLSAHSFCARFCCPRQAVQRIAFGTFLFFALHLVLLLGVTSTRSPRLALHTGFWPFKLLLWGGGCYGRQAARPRGGLYVSLAEPELPVQLVWIFNACLRGQVLGGSWSRAAPDKR